MGRFASLRKGQVAVAEEWEGWELGKSERLVFAVATAHCLRQWLLSSLGNRGIRTGRPRAALLRVPRARLRWRPCYACCPPASVKVPHPGDLRRPWWSFFRAHVAALQTIAPNSCERFTKVRVEARGILKRRVENRLHDALSIWRTSSTVSRHGSDETLTTSRTGGQSQPVQLLQAHVVLNRFDARHVARDLDGRGFIC